MQRNHRRYKEKTSLCAFLRILVILSIVFFSSNGGLCNAHPKECDSRFEGSTGFDGEVVV